MKKDSHITRRLGAAVSLALVVVAISPASAGAGMLTFGGPEAGPGELATLPTGIAVAPNGHVYVADRGNRRVVEFTGDGRFVRAFGGPGTGNGQFGRDGEPYGNDLEQLAVAPDGDVYVADPHNHRVQRFSATGAFLSSFGSEGYEPGEFFVPGGVAVTPDGKVLVTDATGRVQRFSADGTWEATPVSDSALHGCQLAAGADGDFYVAESLRGSLSTSAPTGRASGPCTRAACRVNGGSNTRRTSRRSRAATCS